MGELASADGVESRHRALAEVAISHIRALVTQVTKETETGVPLSGKVVASAAIESLMEQVVTQNILQRMGRAIGFLKKYKEPEDPLVRMQPRLQLNAWAHIYKVTDCEYGTVGDAVKASV